MKLLRTTSVFSAKAALLVAMLMPSFAFAQTTLAPTQPTPQAQTTGSPAATQPAGTAPGTQTAPSGTNPAAPAGTSAFVPLTQLPGLNDVASTKSLPAFLNQLYKICIGAAAVIAVIQIMVAGVQFMTSAGSVSSNEAAKSRIQNAIIGLVLVLSPTIVFAIINPDILKLDLNFANLVPAKLNHLDVGAGTAGQFQGADSNLWQNIGNSDLDTQRCTISGGTLTYECRKKDESAGRIVGVNDTCNADENKLNVCKASAAASTNGQQCSAQYDSILALPISQAQACNAANGFISIPHGCCAGSAPTGNLCCAKPKAASRYLLAYYSVMTNTGTTASCYLPSYQFFSTEAECRADLQKYTAQTASGNVSKPNIVKSCELTPAINYTVPGPTGLTSC